MDEANTICQILGEDIVFYRPKLKEITGSITSAILLQKILYLWDENNGEPFFKFKEPCAHELYEPGKSWVEELGFTRDEFDTALKKIGIRLTRKQIEERVEHDKAVEYKKGQNNITYYSINVKNLSNMLMEIYS